MFLFQISGRDNPVHPACISHLTLIQSDEGGRGNRRRQFNDHIQICKTYPFRFLEVQELRCNSSISLHLTLYLFFQQLFTNPRQQSTRYIHQSLNTFKAFFYQCFYSIFLAWDLICPYVSTPLIIFTVSRGKPCSIPTLNSYRSCLITCLQLYRFSLVLLFILLLVCLDSPAISVNQDMILGITIYVFKLVL